MNDVLTVALERQRELRRQLAEIDEFIGLAESLLRNAKPKAEPHPNHPERAERTDHAANPAHTESAGRPQIVEIPDADPEPVVRRFPWSNAQPPVRRTDADEVGPTRRNLMRREAS